MAGLSVPWDSMHLLPAVSGGASSLSAAQVLNFVLFDLVIILVLARLMGALARRIGQPTVVGEIVAGILLGPTLLGPTLLGWKHPWSFLSCGAALSAGPAPHPAMSVTSCFFPPQSQAVLGILGQIALVLFMFLVGLELDFSLLQGKVRGITMVSVGAVAVPIGLAFLIGPTLYTRTFVPAFGLPAAPAKIAFTLMVGAMLAVTAFPVMARILQEKRLTQSAMGSVGVAAAAVVTVLMFLAVAVASGVAAKQGPSSLGLKFVLAAAYIAVLFLLVRPALAPLGRAYEAKGAVTPAMFSLIMVVVVASAFVAQVIGINLIVGGFLAGAILPARQRIFRELAGRLTDFTAIILLPIFLAFSGLQTDFTKLGVASLAGIGIFLAAGIVGKWLGSAVFARASGLSWQEGNVLGILMNCRGLLVLVVALIAFQRHVISPELQVGGVLMALVTTMMTGPLFDVFARRLPKPAPAGEVAAPAGPPGIFRVLAALGDLDHAPGVAHAAFTLASTQPQAEVVLCRPFPLPRHDELSGINDEMYEVERSVRSLRMLSALAPPGCSVTPLAFASMAPVDDLVRIAGERNCDALVVEDSPIAGAQVQRLLREAPCPVVASSRSGLGDGATGEGSVSLVELAGTAAATVALAGALATALSRSVGRPLERLAPLPEGSLDLSELARRSATVVVAASSASESALAGASGLLGGNDGPAWFVTGGHMDAVPVTYTGTLTEGKVR